MSKKQRNATAAVESTDESQAQGADAGVTDATEADQPGGVVTTEGLPPEADPEQRTDKGSASDPLTDADAAADLAGTPRPGDQVQAYAVAWDVKAGGKWHKPGEAIAPQLVTPELLASGAVVKA